MFSQILKLIPRIEFEHTRIEVGNVRATLNKAPDFSIQ